MHAIIMYTIEKVLLLFIFSVYILFHYKRRRKCVAGVSSNDDIYFVTDGVLTVKLEP